MEPSPLELGYVRFRAETAADIGAVRALNLAAFGREGHLTDEADLVDALRANGRAVLSLVAELAGEVVGHVLFTDVSFESEPSTVKAVALAPGLCVARRAATRDWVGVDPGGARALSRDGIRGGLRARQRGFLQPVRVQTGDGLRGRSAALAAARVPGGRAGAGSAGKSGGKCAPGGGAGGAGVIWRCPGWWAGVAASWPSPVARKRWRRRP